MSIEALQTGLEYARLALTEHDEKYQRHPAMVSERLAIIGDIEAIEAAIQQAEAKTDEPVGEPRARVELMKTGGNAGLSTRIIELDIATRERLRPGDLLYTHPAPSVPMAKAWAEGYRQGIEDERISEANIGIAGFGAKVNPSRQNPYSDTHPAPGVPVGQAPSVWNSIQIASWIGSQLMREPSMFERNAVCKFVRSLGRHPTLLKHSPKNTHPAPGVQDALSLLKSLGPKPWETSPEAHAQARLIGDFESAMLAAKDASA